MAAPIVWRIVVVGFFGCFLFALGPPLEAGGTGFPLLPAAAAANGLVASESTCPDQPASGGAVKMAEARSSMVCMINFARKQRKLRKYRRQGRLDWSAQRKGADILRCRSFSHTACGRKFDYWVRRSGYVRRTRGWMTGENIAWGSGRVGNVRSIFKAWMRSPGHRQAILDRSYRDLGLAVTKGRMKGLGGSRVWVLHFGRIY